MGDCCLNISGVGVTGEGDIVYEVNCVLNGSFPEYTFDVTDGDLFNVFYISYDDENSIWHLNNDIEYLASSEFGGNLTCPDGLQFNYNVEGRFDSTYYTYTVYQIPCDLTPTPPPITYPVECLQEACRNKNLFNKEKRSLAEDIAGISKKEIFGFKCGDAWENIFMRNLIIHALSCMPTGVLSVEKEKCLIGKLTDKCNC
jgi:hypothetical protein